MFLYFFGVALRKIQFSSTVASLQQATLIFLQDLLRIFMVKVWMTRNNSFPSVINLK